MAKIQCPTCKTLLAIQDSALGQQFRCPTCATTLFVPNPSTSSPGGSLPPAPAPAASPPEAKPPATEVKPKPKGKTEAKSNASRNPASSGALPKTVPPASDDSAARRSKSGTQKTFRAAQGRDADRPKTTPAPGPRLASADPSGKVLEVAARPARGKRARGRSPVLYVLATVLAFILPIAAASSFVALNWYSPDLYGVIEIGSKGIKFVHFEIFADQNHGEDYAIRRSEATNTDIVKGMEKEGAFNPTGLDETVNAVRVFYKQLTEECQLPSERIYLVSSSGLFSAIKNSKSLKGEAKELIKANQKKLSDLLEGAIGKKIEFIDTAGESEFQIKGVVRKVDLNNALFVDVGGGGTRGGYRETSGIIKKLEGPGVSKFRGLVKAQAPDLEAFAQTATDLAETELHKPFRQEFERKPGLKQRDKVYLAGGIVWVMANYMHPTKRGSYVRLTAQDFEDFAAKARANPNIIEEFEPPAELGPDAQKKLDEEIKRMRDFFPPEAILAGAEVLRAVSAEFHFADKKELLFYRNGDIAWVLAYVAEKSRPGR